MQPPGADVLHALVHLCRDARDFLHAVRGELERRAIRRAQRRVLLGEGILRLRHDAHEIGLGQRRELDANREAALQLRNQVARLGDMECARRDEEDVIGAHVAVTRLYRRTLDDRQEVALDAFAGHVGAGALAALAGDLVDLVDEDDAVVFDAVQRLVHHVVHVDQLLQLFVDQDAARLVQMYRAALFLLRDQLLNHFAEIDVRPFHALRRLHHLQHRETLLLHLDLDVALLELPVFQLLAQLLTRAAAALLRLGLGLRNFGLDVALRRHDEQLARGGSLITRDAGGRRRRAGGRRRQRRQQQVEETLLRTLFRRRIDVILALGADHVDRDVHQLAHHRLDVAADVAHFGELRGFNLEKRRSREPCQPARDLCFPDARRTDHDDVVRHDLVPDLFGRLGTAPAVADRDGDRLFRRFLPDDVAVQLGDDLLRRQLLQPGERFLPSWWSLRGGW